MPIMHLYAHAHVFTYNAVAVYVCTHVNVQNMYSASTVAMGCHLCQNSLLMDINFRNTGDS